MNTVGGVAPSNVDLFPALIADWIEHTHSVMSKLEAPTSENSRRDESVDVMMRNSCSRESLARTRQRDVELSWIVFVGADAELSRAYVSIGPSGL